MTAGTREGKPVHSERERRQLPNAASPSRLRRPPLAVAVFCDAAAAVTALLLAYLCRFDFELPVLWRRETLLWLVAFALLRPGTLFLTRGYRATWGYFHRSEALALLARAVPLTALVLLARPFMSAQFSIPAGVALMEASFFLVIAGGVRLLARPLSSQEGSLIPVRQTLLVCDSFNLGGAASMLRAQHDSHVYGVISDDAAEWNHSIAGLPVLGGVDALRATLVRHKTDSILMAGAEMACMAEVLRTAADFDVPVFILPTIDELLQRKVRVSRSVELEHVVEAHAVERVAASPAVVRTFQSRTVLITGAGGSIGSELLRQVSALHVERLIVLDQDENSIFELMNEAAGSNLEIVPIIGSVADRDLVRNRMREHRPDIVLHAAAYKHVPVMEADCAAAVRNNVTGTRELAEAALEFECERFVMISTDKAVYPSSVMGATKRVAEMLIQQRAAMCFGDKYRTQFACVRFGNVLGSRGSVIPIFLRQIAAGGPITLTDEEMTRYFMTIPQAVNLVLQAASLESSGDIYVLDMGDPIRILDLAREMIALAGLAPGRDIEIKVTGVRPGEKLEEQLWQDDATVHATEIAQVFRVQAEPVAEEFSMMLAALERAAHQRDVDQILSLLGEISIGYGTKGSELISSTLAKSV